MAKIDENVKVVMLKGEKGDVGYDDTELKGLIAGEAIDRRNNDIQLNTAIVTEKSARESADTSLKEAIDKLNGTPSGSSIVVDKSLAIDGAGADSKTVGDRLKSLDDRNVPITYNTVEDCDAVGLKPLEMRVDTFNAGKPGIKHLPSNFDYGADLWTLESYHCGQGNIVQYLYDNTHYYSRTIFYNNPSKNQAWQDYTKKADAEFHCGPNEQFTTLRSACERAILVKNATVVVHPGTYDLTQEFADHISAKSGTGIVLQNGIRIIFEAGSYVKAEIEKGTGYSQYKFEPFVSRGDFELIGLNISAKNTRYCVHDEHNGQGTYHHIYRNCVMKYRNTIQDTPFIQCIGGGLGEHGFIEINGGVYDAHADSHPDDEVTISYHNGINENCDSKIFISDVYLKNKGNFRFGYYGPSAIKSLVQISNCSVGKPTAVVNENSDPNNKENFEVIEMGVTVRP